MQMWLYLARGLSTDFIINPVCSRCSGHMTQKDANEKSLLPCAFLHLGLFFSRILDVQAFRAKEFQHFPVLKSFLNATIR